MRKFPIKLICLLNWRKDQVTYNQGVNFDFSMTDSFVLTEKDVVMDFDEDCNVDLAELDSVTEMLTRLTSKDQSKVSF